MPIHFKYTISWRNLNNVYHNNYYNLHNTLNEIYFKDTTFFWRSFRHINKTNYIPDKNEQIINIENNNIESSTYYPNYHMFNKHKLKIIPEQNINKIYYKRCGTIIIIPKGEYKFLIVVKGYGGKWSLPKGKPNPKESDEDCAIRETYEETNINLHSLSNCERIKFGKNIYFIYYMNENNLKEQNLISNDTNEIEKVEIVNINDIFLLDCNKDLRNLTKIINKI